ncbi:MAG: DUF4321 domain-containing protein [Sporomusaceae bacterium]|nr:DUF4321 domain-containing protein [Sporomusaceae bacterium]
MRGGQTKNAGLFLLFLLTGAVVGGILGEMIANSSMLVGIAPYLVKAYPILDVPPMTVNLYIIRFVFGFSIYPNLVSLLGMFVAVFLYRRF